MSRTERDAEPERDLDEPETRSLLHRTLVVALPALVVVGLIGYGFLRPAPEEQGPPSFELPLLEGGTLSDAEVRGDPVVLNFWASWCAPCREEMPAFQRVWERYRDDGVRVIGVNVQDSRIGAREFVNEIGVTYPILYDPDEELAGPLGVFGLPQTFFITSDYTFAEGAGRQREEPVPGATGPGGQLILGAISEEELVKQIEALLEER